MTRDPRAAPRRGSAWRRILVPALLAGSLAGCGGPGEALRDPWFGGYTSVTAYPYRSFAEDPSAQGRTVLAFVVADPEEACTPSWGGYFGLDEAAERLRLDGQIAAVREQGRDVAISFGGAAGDELATVCTDEDRLHTAYRTVIDRYGADTVDFDIEMDDLEDREAARRRAEVVARLQEDRAADDPLEVWVTLPVGLQGLDGNSRDVVAQMLDAGVDLAGVNLMTMNYGQGKPAGMSQLEASTTAARAAHAQVRDLYAQAGRELSDELVWNRIGLTPMIGRNDASGEVFDLDAADRLNRFAREQGVGRLSFWSTNRDRPCPADLPDPQGATDGCSGIEQEPGDFGRALGAGFGTGTGS